MQKPGPRNSANHTSDILLKSSALVLTLLLASTLAIAQIPDDARQTRQQLEAVNAAMVEIQSWLDAANSRHSAAEARLRETELAFSELRQQSDTLQALIDSNEAELTSLRRQQSALEQQRQNQADELAQLLRSQYMAGEPDLLKLLLGQQSMSQKGRLLHYTRLLSSRQQQRLEEFRRTLGELAQLETDLDQRAQQLQLQRQQLQQQTQELAQIQQSREQALQALDAEIASRSDELYVLETDRAQLEALLEEIARALEGVRSFADVPPFAEQRGSLPRPVEAPVISGFGQSVGGGLQRQGLVLGAETGSPVRAVHAGQVVFADWLRGAGLLLIVDHGDGYMSLYGANEALARRAGDWVDAGDIIATSGRGGSDSSPGLYFEIRRNGRPLDPSVWLLR